MSELETKAFLEWWDNYGNVFRGHSADITVFDLCSAAFGGGFAAGEESAKQAKQTARSGRGHDVTDLYEDKAGGE